MFKYSKLLVVVLLFFTAILHFPDAFALSEYGLRCADNKKCVECSENIRCLKCMHRCWNKYGYADTDVKSKRLRNSEENCQLKRAKWCNAQCWDPDDVVDNDYISTKPSCDSKSFYFPRGGIKPPENRPDF